MGFLQFVRRLDGGASPQRQTERVRVLGGRCLLRCQAPRRRVMSRLAASCAAAALLVGCSVRESTRSGGLIAPVNATAPTQATEPSGTSPATLVTIAAADDLGAAMTGALVVGTGGAGDGGSSLVAGGGMHEEERHREGGEAESGNSLDRGSVVADVVEADAAGDPGSGLENSGNDGERRDGNDHGGHRSGSDHGGRRGGSGDVEQDSVATSSGASSRSEPTAPDAAQRRSAVHEVLAAADPPDGFGEGVLTVESAAGTQTWPVVIADTARARQQGLMGVADFGALGGYAAMVFVFESDTSGAFWMRDTPLPLRITFVTAEGAVVSTADMTPCLAPTPSSDCERYHPDGPYRIAVEHPLGPAFDIGLAAADHVMLAAH